MVADSSDHLIDSDRDNNHFLRGIKYCAFHIRAFLSETDEYTEKNLERMEEFYAQDCKSSDMVDYAHHLLRDCSLVQCDETSRSAETQME